MFGKGATAVIDQIPRFPDLEPAEVRRLLSTAYLDVVAARSSGARTSGYDDAFIRDYLRRLANALESHAVFNGEADMESRRASAFVAAEALALLADLGGQTGSEPAPAYRRLTDSTTFSCVEAALLYLVAGFDPNAGTIIEKLLHSPVGGSSSRVAECEEWALANICAFAALRSGLVPSEIPPQISREELIDDLHVAVRAGLFRELGKSAGSCLRWLIGGQGDPSEILARIERIGEAVVEAKGAQHADLHHLARLLGSAFESVQERALRTIPAPNDAYADEFAGYLRSRSGAGRPLLWPAAMEYVRRCLPGPHQHAVVAVPTGSGKSFIGELAIVHGALDGWGLYLVPTNALANQVQRDLERALERLGITVQAFLGADEYTTLEEERIPENLSGIAVVMTPEKCALALRLSPKAFTSCRAVVFDECHLLADEHRGVIAELVLSHVLALAPSCRVLLMSAMMANTDEIADWLTAATEVECAVIRAPWRPTQTLRGVVGIDQQRVDEELRSARTRLQARPPSRQNEKFNAHHVIVANLQGAWSAGSADDYVLVQLPTVTTLKVNRRGRIDKGGWANATLRSLVVHLAERGIPVLGFVPGSKHFPFSVGKGVAADMNGAVTRDHGDLVHALLEIARDELGVETTVGNLLDNGVAVHSAALLDSERKASELAFRNGSAAVMLATGTLAQGLNLPAEAVVIGGTAVGDQREAETPEGHRRTQAQLLNALGRAGRAGVANHGVGLVVTNSPLVFNSPPDTTRARQEAGFLAEEDDSSVVTSRLDAFVESVLGGHIDAVTASPDELVALSYLAVDSDSPVEASEILARTHAIRRRALRESSINAQAVAANLVALSDEFLRDQGAPPWITAVAYRTGLPFLMSLRLAQALSRVVARWDGDPPETIAGWLHLLFQVIQLLPPDRAKELLGLEISSAKIGILWAPSVTGDDPNWRPTRAWIDAWDVLESAASMYCHGEQLADLARLLFDATAPVDPGRSTGAKPIPRTIGFLRVLDRISRVAGALLAIHELAEVPADEGEVTWCFLISEEEKKELAALSLAMRFGCNDMSALAWYRFGIRFRRPSALLSQQFPLPANVTTDPDIRQWIQTARGEWLLAIPESEAHGVLRATRIVLQN